MTTAQPVAVVGMACVFPGAPDVATFWRNVLEGVDATSDVPADRIDPVFFTDPAAAADAEGFYCRRGGFISDHIAFDPSAFGIMPVAARDAEPDQLLALLMAQRALEDAGLGDGVTTPDRAGVVIGRGGYITSATARLSHRVHTSQQLVEAIRLVVPEMGEELLGAIKHTFQQALGPSAPDQAIGIVPNLVASRAANRLDLHGPAYTVDAACASSLVALSHAVDDLAFGRADLMLAGGVHHCHDVTLWSVFTQLGALSRSQVIRPFDRNADGIVIGEGTGMVVLKRLEDAERDGDRIYAVLRGLGLASDGRAGTLMSPATEGQVIAVERAWAAAGLDPATVGLVEGHGTATTAGDASEVATLRHMLGDAPGPPVGLGSVKSMIGHAMPASGIAGFIKAALAVHHGVLPPTLHCEEPHPDLEGTRLVPVTVTDEWPDTGTPRRAVVDSFGFGGINGHAVIEAHASAQPSRARHRRSGPNGAHHGAPGTHGAAGGDGDAVSAAARSAAAIAAATAGTTGPEAPPPFRLFVASGATAADVRARLADGDAVLAGSSLAEVEARGPARLVIADPTPRRLTLARQITDKGTPWRGRNDIWFAPDGLVSAGGKVAFAFPGVEAVAGADIDDVVEHFGLDMPPYGYASELGRQGTGIVRVGRVLHAALAALGVEPDVVVGHSLGEWTAMIAAGAIPRALIDEFVNGVMGGELTFPDLVYLACGCGLERAEQAIAERPSVVVSHDNCPHQVIVCGPAADIAAVRDGLLGDKVLCQELPFRTGFHTPMFADHLDGFVGQVAHLSLELPHTPLWSGVTAAPFPADVDAIWDVARRLYVEPVRFRRLVANLYDEGVRVFVQPGTGTIAGFVADTLAGRQHLAVAAAAPNGTGLGHVARAAGALWVEGADVHLDRLAPRASAPPTAAATAAATATAATAAAAVLASGGPAAGVPAASATGPAGRRRQGRPMTISFGTNLVRPAFERYRPMVVAAGLGAGAADPLADLDLAAVVGAGASTGAEGLLAEFTATLRTTSAASREVMDAFARAAPTPPTSLAPTSLATTAPAGAPALPPAAASPAPPAVPPVPASPPAAPAARHPASPRAGAGAGAGGGGGTGTSTAPRSARPRRRDRLPGSSAQPHWHGPGRSRSGPQAHPGASRPGVVEGGPGRRTLVEHHDVSVDAMPWLVDHMFFRQPDDVGTLEDRFPVVPMTMMVDMAVRAAARVVPEQVVVGLSNVRALRWLAAEPPVEAVLEAREDGPGVVKVSIANHFRATVHLADAYPPAPPADDRPLTDAEPAPHTGPEIYELRWMFHGPEYQGITRTAELGPDGMTGTVVALPAPGALLDAVGQMFGYWISYSLTEARMALPFRIDRIDLFGPHPEPGERLAATVRIAEVGDTTVRGDFELAWPDGSLWARVTGFTDRRFEGTDAVIWTMFYPESTIMSEERGAWFVAHDPSTTSAGRDMIMRRYLGSAEREQYAALTPKAQSPWLMGRVAVKDAVRRWLWRRGAGPLFPMEVQVANDEDGRPVVTCAGHEPVRVSLAHAGGTAVAAVERAAGDSEVGIDIEPVAARSEAFAAMALTPGERRLGAGHEPDAWVARLWTAKEAAAKAAGTGLRGRPEELEAVEIDGDWTRIGDRWIRTEQEGEFVVSYVARR